jgi:hypothetical protein
LCRAAIRLISIGSAAQVAIENLLTYGDEMRPTQTKGRRLRAKLRARAELP